MEGGVIEHNVGGFVERGVVQSGVGVGDEGTVVEWSGLVLVGGTVQQRSFVGLFEGGVDGCGVGPDNEGTVGEVVHWLRGNVGVVGSNWGRMVQSGVGGVGCEGRGNVGWVRLDRLRNIGGGRVEAVDRNWIVEGSVGVVEGLLIGEATVVGGFDGVVDGSVGVGKGLIVGHCSVGVVEADNVINSSAVVRRDIVNNSSIVRVHNLIWVVQCSILTIQFCRAIQATIIIDFNLVLYSSIKLAGDVGKKVLTIVDNYVDFIVVDVSGDVEFSVVGGDFGWDESGFVAVGDVEENIRSPVLVDEVEDDVRGAVGVGDVGSDGQIGLIFVCDVGCKSEVTISVVEGRLEDDRAVFVVDGCVGGHRAVAVCHWWGEVDWTVLIADGEIVVDCSVVGGHFGGWDHRPVHWGHVGVWADSAVGGSNAAVGAEGAVR